jgi:hypothetical protein
MMSNLLRHPDDPDYRECEGCGYCCEKAICGFGRFHGMTQPCQSLVKIDGKFRCQLVIDSKDPTNQLFIGLGCCCPLNSRRSDSPFKSG